MSDVEINNSELHIGLYDNEYNFKHKSGAIDSIILIPTTSIVKLLFKDVPIGNYAIATFQDLNNNGKLDVKKFKIPTEPIGISNYPIGNSKLPPTFNKAKFKITGDTLIIIPLVHVK